MNLTKKEKDILLQNLRTVLLSTPDYTGCDKCDHFQLTGLHCRFLNAEVPRDFVEKGCKDFREEGVPF